MTIDWKFMHKKGGCIGCEHVDMKAIHNKGPACTYAYKLKMDENGKCLINIKNRKDK